MEHRATAYGLSQEWIRIVYLLETAEDEDEVSACYDEIERLEDETAAKLQGCAGFVRYLEAAADEIKAEGARLAQRAKSAKGQADRMRELMRSLMVSAGLAKSDGARYTIRLSKPRATASVENLDLVPDELKTPQDPKVDKTAIKKRLERGESVPGCSLVYGAPPLVIR